MVELEFSFSTDQQQDVYEFLRLFLGEVRQQVFNAREEFHLEWNNYDENNFLDIEFSTQTKIIYQCQTCKDPIETEVEEHTHILAVHLEKLGKCQNLQDLILKRLVNEETVVKECSKCDVNNTDHSRRSILKKLPETLIIALLRHDNDLNKNNSPVGLLELIKLKTSAIRYSYIYINKFIKKKFSEFAQPYRQKKCLR